MSTLWIKIIFMPIVIWVVTLVSRRFGNAIGGVIAGMPWVGGAILFFIAIEQGKSFAIDALPGATVGLVAWLGFCMSYVWIGQRLAPVLTLLLSNLICLTIGAMMLPLLPLISGGGWTAILFVYLTISLRFFPEISRHDTRALRPIKVEITLRMIMVTLFVLLLTYFADLLGPGWSGILTPFPVITATLALFTHIGQGIAQVRIILLGMYTGVFGFGSFLLSLMFLLPVHSIGFSFAISILINVFFALAAKVVFDKLKLGR